MQGGNPVDVNFHERISRCYPGGEEKATVTRRDAVASVSELSVANKVVP
jgi:hypothetical protein